MSLKEVARRVMPRPLVAAIKAVRHRREFGGLDHAQVFAKIHAENLWRNDESVSGNGSTVAATAALRTALRDWLAAHRPRTFVDMACGDFNWMQHVVFPEATLYRGVDIVPALIAGVQQRFGSASRSFAVGDILTSELPDAEVYFCKDLFLHFPNAAIAAATARVLPRCEYFLSTTFPEVAENEDIRFGAGRRFNLALVLGEAVELLPDFAGDDTGRYIGVWRGVR